MDDTAGKETSESAVRDTDADFISSLTETEAHYVNYGTGSFTVANVDTGFTAGHYDLIV